MKILRLALHKDLNLNEFDREILYSNIPGHRNCQIETAVWNSSWAGFFTVPKKPAGSNLGSFLMIYRNWVSVFLIKKSVFLIKNLSQKRVFLIKNLSQKWVFILKNRSSKIGFPYQKWVLKNRSSASKIKDCTGGVGCTPIFSFTICWTQIFSKFGFADWTQILFKIWVQPAEHKFFPTALFLHHKRFRAFFRPFLSSAGWTHIFDFLGLACLNPKP